MADLHQCQAQGQDGAAELFQPGAQDVSNRFEISQRLYGREPERARLQEAFERTSQGPGELVLIAGYAGVGKTALVQELYRSITQRRGYFIAGKFEQLRRATPYSALIQAFRMLIRFILMEAEAQVEAWRQKLQQALGPNGQLIADVIPELQLIVGQPAAVPAVSPAEAQNRFRLVFGHFIQVFTQPEHPLVMFLDDLQWADAASLELLGQLLLTPGSRCVLLLGAYRDNEVAAFHPLPRAVEEVRKGGALVSEIRLGPLALEEVTQWLADTLHGDPARTGPLADLVLTKTGGNPFFINEFLRTLHAQQWLTFDDAQRQWTWNLEQIQAHGITRNLVELLTDKIEGLPAQAQAVLKLAACIGHSFDLRTLAIVYDRPARVTALHLWPAVQHGLVLPLSENYSLASVEVDRRGEAMTVEYKFAHDRVQQAAYALIPAAERQTAHWRIGQLLLANLPPAEQEARLFDLLHHLNEGGTPGRRPVECLQVARLNLAAGQRAKAAAAFRPAFDYFQAGRDWLPAGSWADQYALTLALHLEAAEAAYLSGEFAVTDELVDQVTAHAQNALDTVAAYNAKAQAYLAQFRMVEGLAIAREALGHLGLRFPARPTKVHVLLSYVWTRLLVARRTLEALRTAPVMTDPTAVAAMHFLSSVAPAAYTAAPDLLSLLTLCTVRLTVRYGTAAESAQGFVSFGLICNALGDIESGYRFGQLGLAWLEQFSAGVGSASVVLFNYLIRHWKEPLRNTLPTLTEASAVALDHGEFSYGSLGMSLYGIYAFFSGQELGTLAQEIKTLGDLASRIKQERAIYTLRLFRQVALNLLGQSPQPGRLQGESYDEAQMRPILEAAGNRSALNYLYTSKLILSYLFQDYAEAAQNADLARRYLDGVPSMPCVPLYHFYDALTCLARYAEAPAGERPGLLRRVTAHEQKLNRWAKTAPMNYQHKAALVAAERARVTGRGPEAREKYDQAIALAAENGYINEEALACELAGQFYRGRPPADLALHYLRQARYAYLRWGAAAKVRDLEARYPELQIQPVEAGDSAMALDTKSTTDRHPASALDLASVLKTWQAISGELALDKVLERFISVLMENAGAQRGFLILAQDGDLTLQAECEVDQPGPRVLQNTPLRNATGRLSAAVVHYVIRMQEDVVLNHAAEEGAFTRDPYIAEHQPKSLLCLLILSRRHSLGVLYLENNLVTGGFPPERVELLKMLAEQAAISLENAQLYASLEQKVEERTTQLKRALDEIEQLATTDKLSGAYNRRKFDDVANHEIQRARRFHHPLTLVLFDLDHFKWVNDVHGHQVGDALIRRVTTMVQNNLRGIDTLARWGGDEFAILAPEATLEQAAMLAERIRAEVEQRAFPPLEHITVSIGVAEFDLEETLDELLRRADEALYRAKRGGRNQVACETRD